MGARTALSLIERAAELLLDDDEDTPFTQWPAAQHLAWLNLGQLEIVNTKSDANPVRAPLVLVAGTRQSLPAPAIDLIEVPRNLGVGGAAPGPAITHVSLVWMNQALRDWRTHPASAVVEHYLFDEREKRVFHVYPPQPATPATVELIYSARPAEITDIDDPITLDDDYANALIDYLMFRAHQKTSKRGELVKAQFYWQAFLQDLGAKEQAERGLDPRARAPSA